MAAIAGGVLWSNALAYGSVWLAPRNQLAELETIGHRFAGDGPTLMTEYQPYGVRHFLRNLDAEGASELRVRPVALRNGGILDKAQYADLDAFDLSAVLVYRTLVLRTSPLASRPPSVYVPVWTGRSYEVWQRPLEPARILAHLPLGNDSDPEGVPSCAAVMHLGSLAAENNGTLVAAERPRAPGRSSTGTISRAAGRQARFLARRFLPRPRAASHRRQASRLNPKPAGRDRADDPARVCRTERRPTSARASLRRCRLASRQPRNPIPRRTARRRSPGNRRPTPTRTPADTATLCGRPLDWIEAVAPA